MQRLLIDPQQIQGVQVTFTAEQNHYLYRVLRLGAGDRIAVIDGMGNAWVVALQGNWGELLERLTAATELPLTVTLVVALPKGDRFESIVRSCTELGASIFIPVLSDRALLKPSANKLQRWRRIAGEAAEQSERYIVPKIVEPLPFSAPNWTDDLPDARYLCVARKESPFLLDKLLERDEGGGDMAIATGPEGGWTEAEIDRAIAQGFQPVSLGKRILRAATAPIAALSLVAAVAEREERLGD